MGDVPEGHRKNTYIYSSAPALSYKLREHLYICLGINLVSLLLFRHI